MRRHRFALLIPILAGCYIYRPAPESTPPPGERVRLTLTDSGVANLAAQLGPSTEALSGRLVHDSAGSYFVSVLSTRRRNGIESDWAGEQVAVPRPLVARIEQRSFSRSRTVFMTIALITAGIAVREAFWGTGSTFGGAPPGGGGPGPR